MTTIAVVRVAAAAAAIRAAAAGSEIQKVMPKPRVAAGKTVANCSMRLAECRLERHSVERFEWFDAIERRQRRPDIRVARERLAWTPQVSLEQGLIRTIRYFDRLLSHGAAAVRMERPRVSVGMRR